MREHLRVLAEHLRERRIRRRELLDDRLCELGVLRHDAAQVLHLRVLRQRAQAARAPGTEPGEATATAARLLRLLSLLGELEEVLGLSGLGWLGGFRRLGRSGGGRLRWGSSRWRLGRGGRSLGHMLEVRGNALQFPRNLSAQDMCGRLERR